MRYEDIYQQSISQPEQFWRQQAENIAWFRAPQQILTAMPDGTHRWYQDGELNSCYLAVDRNIEEGRGEQVALYYDSPVTETKTAITFNQLKQQVCQLASALRAQGVEKGDRVVIYMPMVPEAAVAMLACARLGAVHSVVFGGFAPNELAIRINDATPRLVITASCGIEFTRVIEYKPLVDEALQLATHQPEKVIVLQRPMATAAMQEGRDLDWYACQQGHSTDLEPVPVAATDPLYILYTSGTTGLPKGIVRDNGGHAVSVTFGLRYVYDMHPGDTWWAVSDIGWAVGHSYIVYGPLMGGCSVVFFEGKPVRTPDAGTFWRVIEEYRVKAMFAAPTAFRAIRKEDPEGELMQRYNLSSLKSLFVAGEKLDSATYHWLANRLQIPVVDHWWQTETGWPMTAPLMGLDPKPTRLGSTCVPVPGYQVMVLDEQGEPVEAGDNGYIVARLPMPPGVAQSVWNNPRRYIDSYLTRFPGYYHTGDGGYIDEDGYVFITGRTDDVINVAGHRLSTGEMEECVSAHPAVAECAVIAVADELKGQVPVGLVVLKADATLTAEALQAELVAKVRRDIGALACFQRAVVVQRLPKTRSGKILRAILRKIADNQPYTPPSTIDDMSILPEITDLMRQAGVGN
ncbi:propionyl-CoA synthetase [Pokkaliibacter sp. MBI-7]|uniref:propionyl-CoA synthetase n=1 Tax=Pokkaliibacter sp. MBI-7 TaxID=3040600 RepID=UPI00244C211F|nr:propionyl-CoA synthetase [Pokkaliibacter sp. MBI-7]MDH2431104.1 propionyl-CoA synthetase [Pokkaliibacter sp. MBI-7]